MFSTEHIIHFFRFEITRNLVKKIHFSMLSISLTISQLFRVALTGSGACHRRHTLWWENLLSKWQASDSLIWQKQLITYTFMSHELLGYMRCLFFKVVTESFIFFRFFLVWFLLYGNTFAQFQSFTKPFKVV